jgi:hypothetical protein
MQLFLPTGEKSLAKKISQNNFTKSHCNIYSLLTIASPTFLSGEVNSCFYLFYATCSHFSPVEKLKIQSNLNKGYTRERQSKVIIE